LTDQQQPTSLCTTCGGALKLAAGSVAKLSAPGFVDFLKCDDCGSVITSDQKAPPKQGEPPR